MGARGGWKGRGIVMSAQPIAAEAENRKLVAVPSGVGPQLRTPHSIGGPLYAGRQHQIRKIVQNLHDSVVLEGERGTATLLVPIAIGIGALGYFHAPHEPGWTPLFLWFVSTLGLAITLRAKPVSRMLALALALAISGALLAKFEVARANTRILGSEVTTRLTGDVVEIDYLSNGRARLVLDVVKTERPVLRYQPGRVRVSASRLPASIVAGTRLAGLVKLHPPSGPILPAGYDFSFESFFDGLGASGYFLTPPHVVSQQQDWRPGSWLDNIRNRIASRIRSAIDGPEGEIAAALIVGVRAGIPERVNESLRRTGLAHILSISGLHMALVAAIAMGGIRCVLAAFPGFSSRRPTKKFAAAGALSLVSLYLLISGADIAAQRSFLMLAIMLIAVLVDRRALSMRNLAIAAVIVIAVSPHEIVGPSFQMSFAATAALVGIYGIWSSSKLAGSISTRPRTRGKLASELARIMAGLILGTVLTAIVAGLATSIFGAWHFQRVSPLSLFANLAVSPIVSLVVMPFAVLAMLAMPFGADPIFLTVMGKGLSLMLFVSDWLSERSPFDAVGVIPASSVLWLTVALLFASIPTTPLRWAAPIFAALGLVMLLNAELPDILVSEDATLVAAWGPEGTVHLNRRQSNSFTLDTWKRALVADRITEPVNLKIADKNASNDDIAEALLSNVSKRRFICAGELCLIEHSSGAIIAISTSLYVSPTLCAIADVVVIQKPSFQASCPKQNPLIISSISLARYGTTAVYLRSLGHGVPTTKISHALKQPYRRWHAHRAYSRASRGLLPYEPRQSAHSPTRNSANGKEISRPE